MQDTFGCMQNLFLLPKCYVSLVPSLMTLKMVMTQIANHENVSTYRHSKLTQHLENSLSGNAGMALICCVNPDRNFNTEIVRTLEFGKQMKSLTTNI